MILVDYLRSSQRLFLLLNLFLGRVLSNHEISYQALISHRKTSNKKNNKSQKVRVTVGYLNPVQWVLAWYTSSHLHGIHGDNIPSPLVVNFAMKPQYRFLLVLPI